MRVARARSDESEQGARAAAVARPPPCAGQCARAGDHESTALRVHSRGVCTVAALWTRALRRSQRAPTCRYRLRRRAAASGAGQAAVHIMSRDFGFTGVQEHDTVRRAAKRRAEEGN